ncbi:MAG: alpha/beta hydrolase [Oscillospiraceae bacterium]|nr:alpha/beta hydrolase [Oscillospiraceae bacterium]
MTEERVFSFSLPYPEREDRLVRVFVPSHEEGETFPVIYMTDGQNLFDKESSGFGCWYTREAVREERQKSGRAAIIVGVHNTDPWRTNELMPKSIGEIFCREEDRPFIDPQGEIFDDFVVSTLIPAVEARFPVKPGRENRAFCGSSMGGLMSFFTVLSHPELFSAAGVLSPAFHLYSKADMRRWLQGLKIEQKPFLYLYTGAEGELEQDIRRSLAWTYKIVRAFYPADLLKYVVKPDQIHHEVAWEPIFRDLLHLFLTK